jgi:hypothetical protein
MTLTTEVNLVANMTSIPVDDAEEVSNFFSANIHPGSICAGLLRVTLRV